MIRLTINDVLTALPVMRALSSYPVHAKTALNIARIIRELESEYKIFDTQRRNTIMKYAECDENGQVIMENDTLHVKPEMIETCNEEIAELLSTELSLNVEPINIDEFEDNKLTPDQVYNIMAFIQ